MVSFVAFGFLLRAAGRSFFCSRENMYRSPMIGLPLQTQRPMHTEWSAFISDQCKPVKPVSGCVLGKKLTCSFERSVAYALRASFAMQKVCFLIRAVLDPDDIQRNVLKLES